MTAIRLRVDITSATPPYEQIRAQVRDLIAADRLREGDRLPTVRALAAELGLAVNTVARAYRELEADGLVHTAGRAGTVVAPGSQSDDVALGRAAAAFAERALVAGLSDAEAAARIREAMHRARG
jgi:DNA-binding transcriptional regulator YhcF (GntR family)